MFVASEAAVLIKEHFEAAFIETLRRDNFFYSMCRESHGVEYNEKDIRWKINYSGNSSVGSYTENAHTGSAGEQAYTTATMGWAQNGATVRVSGLAQQISKGSNSVTEAVGREVEAALEDLKRNLNLQCLSDGLGYLNGANPVLAKGGLTADITGILAAVDDGSLVTNYANVDRSTNVWWRSFVLDNGGVFRPLTEALMMQVLTELQIRSMEVSHILCSPSTFNKYALLLKQERRQVNPGQRLEGGWRTLDFAGIPVTAVPDYEENRMDFVNMKEVEYLTLLDFAVEPRDPGSYDASQFFIKHYSQMVYRNPWHAGSLRDIA
jgi:hypothetical protein